MVVAMSKDLIRLKVIMCRDLILPSAQVRLHLQQRYRRKSEPQHHLVPIVNHYRKPLGTDKLFGITHTQTHRTYCTTVTDQAAY